MTPEEELRRYNTQASPMGLVHLIKKHYHQRAANKLQDKAANHHAKALHTLSKKMSHKDMKHYLNGDTDKISKRGQKALNNRTFNKHLQAAKDTDSKALGHTKKAVDSHAKAHNIKPNKLKAMHGVAKRNHHYNSRVKSLNNLHARVGNSNDHNLHKNVKHLTNSLHEAAHSYKANAKAIAKQANLKKSQKNIMSRASQQYKTPKINAKMRANHTKGNPRPKEPKNGVINPTNLDTGHEEHDKA